MKVRDLFDGYAVTLAPALDEWTVQLVDEDGLDRVTIQYDELPEALELVHEWALLLVDDSPLRASIELSSAVLLDRMRVNLARHAAGASIGHLPELELVGDRDRLRAWFEREIGE